MDKLGGCWVWRGSGRGKGTYTGTQGGSELSAASAGKGVAGAAARVPPSRGFTAAGGDAFAPRGERGARSGNGRGERGPPLPPPPPPPPPRADSVEGGCAPPSSVPGGDSSDGAPRAPRNNQLTRCTIALSLVGKHATCESTLRVAKISARSGSSTCSTAGEDTSDRKEEQDA